MAKKKSASSPREKRIPASVLFTQPLSERQLGELKALRVKPDTELDYSDAPERHPKPSEVHIGKFYRPIKQLVSIRVDADVLAWYRSRGKRPCGLLKGYLQPKIRLPGKRSRVVFPVVSVVSSSRVDNVAPPFWRHLPAGFRRYNRSVVQAFRGH